MIHDFFDALAKGTEELKKKFCDLISSRDALINENELLKYTLEQQTKQYEITYRELKGSIIERNASVAEKERLQTAFETVNKAYQEAKGDVKKLMDEGFLIPSHAHKKTLEENAALQKEKNELQTDFDKLYSEVKEVVNERFYLKTANRTYENHVQNLNDSLTRKENEIKELKERLRTSDSCVHLLSDEVKVLREKLIGEHAPYYEELEKLYVERGHRILELESGNKSLKDQNRNLQKEKDDGFFIDALKVKDVVDKNKSLEESLKTAIAQRDINFRRAENQAQVIGQRNSRIAGLQKRVEDLEAVKNTHETYAGVAPWSIPRPNSDIEFFCIRWQMETRIQGIEEKTLYIGGYPIKVIIDSSLPKGTIIIK